MGPALAGPAASDSALPTKHFDVANLSDPLPPAEGVAAADVLYDPAAAKALARRAMEALRGGSRFVVGDSVPGRIDSPGGWPYRQ
jgi:hypothetical protein